MISGLMFVGTHEDIEQVIYFIRMVGGLGQRHLSKKTRPSALSPPMSYYSHTRTKRLEKAMVNLATPTAESTVQL